ncbi:MAG: hypothetical protein WDN00_18010 [Limisphaerales bacterium]
MKTLMSFITALGILFEASCPVHAQEWSITAAPPILCPGVACSSDGLKLVALGSYPDSSDYFSAVSILVSTNRGADWTAPSVIPMNLHSVGQALRLRLTA